MDIIPPHKNHIRLFSFVISILLVAGAIMNIYVRNKKNPDYTNVNEKINTNLENSNLTFEKIDTDKDGLEDWQETLWKTDTERADSDGDGTNDGDEVREGRDPFLAGPNDMRVDDVYKLTKQITNPPATPERSDWRAGNLQPDTLLSDKDLLKEYGNEIGSILVSYVTYIQSSPKILDAVIKNHDDKSFADLNALKKAYLSLAEELSEVVTTKESSVIHDTLVENYEAVAYEIQSLETYSGREIPAEKWKTYNDSVVAVGNTLIDIADLFKKEGVIFTPTESGSIFSF